MASKSELSKSSGESKYITTTIIASIIITPNQKVIQADVKIKNGIIIGVPTNINTPPTIITTSATTAISINQTKFHTISKGKLKSQSGQNTRFGIQAVVQKNKLSGK